MKYTIYKFSQRLAGLLIFILLFASDVFPQTLDQDQPVNNGGTSERNLPGYYEWQSFTAGLSGPLCQIDLMFCNTSTKVNGTGTLKVYTGQGTAGSLLLTQSVTVNGTAYSTNQRFWQSWTLSATPAISAGSVYTFQFIPTQGGGLTDPYLIQINIPSVYAGGQNYNLGTVGDCAFRTYVSSSSLPVQLIGFNAKEEECHIRLEWTTATELNNDYFTVEKSVDGLRFEIIKIVSGAGTSDIVQDYSAVDEYPWPGINYFRLKQTDYNGDFSYSRIIAVHTNAAVRQAFIYPSGENGTWLLHWAALAAINIKVIDIDGRIILEEMVANSLVTINLSNYPPGMYMVMMAGDGIFKNIKLFKH